MRAAYDSAPHNLRTTIYHLESYAQVQRQMSNEFSFINFYQGHILKDYSEIFQSEIQNIRNRFNPLTTGIERFVQPVLEMACF